MRKKGNMSQLPYAMAYPNLADHRASLQTSREVLYFTAYLLLRTAWLTLV